MTNGFSRIVSDMESIVAHKFDEYTLCINSFYSTLCPSTSSYALWRATISAEIHQNHGEKE